jgi:hypothetical protein
MTNGAPDGDASTIGPAAGALKCSDSGAGEKGDGWARDGAADDAPTLGG